MVSITTVLNELKNRLQNSDYITGNGDLSYDEQFDRACEIVRNFLKQKGITASEEEIIELTEKMDEKLFLFDA